MPTLTMTKGLPGSGKTTWALAVVDKSKGRTKRINKDDLRAMIDNGSWSKHNEKAILGVRDGILGGFLSNGFNVIIDDTNLAPKHEQNLRRLAEAEGAYFIVEDFTDVPMEDCVRRDLRRPDSVGYGVIKDMYDSFLKPAPIGYNPPENAQHAIICDIDGTLAHMRDRSPFAWHRVGEDDVDPVVRNLLIRHRSADIMNEHPTEIILLSGRDSVCRSETIRWLRENGIPYDKLFMRAPGDNRKDSIVKRELFDKFIADRYNIQFILDDRQQVVDMWRAMGLKVLQVAEGNF